MGNRPVLLPGVIGRENTIMETVSGLGETRGKLFGESFFIAYFVYQLPRTDIDLAFIVQR